MIRLRPFVLAVACASSLLVASCSDGSGGSGAGSDGADGLRKFTVVLDWTPNTNHAGMYLAQSEGWYEEAGLDVEFIEPGEAGALQVLAAGKADVAVSVQEDVTPAVAEGLPVKSVAAVIAHNTSGLLSLADDGIVAPADLAGKTYGGYGGQLEVALLDRLMECDGADPDQLKTVDVGEADFRVGLERDQYDVVWVFDGWDGIRLNQLDGLDTNEIRFIENAGCVPDWYTPLLAASTKVQTERADDLRAFLAATARGYEEAMADPNASAEALLAAAPDLDPELVQASAEYLSTRYADDPTAWGRQEAVTWDQFTEFLTDAELLTTPVDPDDAWTNDFLPKP